MTALALPGWRTALGVSVARPRDTAIAGRFIEFFGPAGCGKSTLVARLESQRAPLTSAGGLWGQSRARLARHFLALAPVAASAARERLPLATGEMLQMMRLDALRARLLDLSASEDASLRLIDEGPLFGLAWLLVFHHARGAARRAWRARFLADVAPMLHAAVHLEADDGVLAQRIRARAKPHMMKRSDDAAIRAFSDRFRAAFDVVLAELRRERRIRIVELRTDTMSLERQADLVTHAFDGSANAG